MEAVKSLGKEVGGMNPEDVLGRRQVLMVSLLIAGVLVGGVATYLGTNMNQVSSQKAGENVVSTLERQTGQQYELVRVENQDGLYRVDVTGANDQLQTYFVTKNGKMLTSTLTDMEQVNNLLDAREDFSNCMTDRGVVMYGNSTQLATVRQIQVLGGTRYLPVYKDVNSPDNLQEAVDRGITSVPAFYYNGSTLEGVNGINSLQQFTGCQFQVS